MNHAQIKAVLEGVIPEVKAAIAAAQKPLIERIAEIEAREPVKGEKGDPGEAIIGPPGKDGPTIDDIEPLIDRAVAGIKLPLDGKDGADGTSITLDDVAPLIDKAVAEIQEAVAAIPAPKDGRDGLDGRDGRPGELSLAPDDVADQIAKTIAMLAESPPIHRSGSHTMLAAAPRPTSFEFERDENNNIIAAHGVDA
jgi:hypothetical protein